MGGHEYISMPGNILDSNNWSRTGNFISKSVSNLLYTWGDQGKNQSYLRIDNIYIYVCTMSNVISVTV